MIWKNLGQTILLSAGGIVRFTRCLLFGCDVLISKHCSLFTFAANIEGSCVCWEHWHIAVNYYSKFEKNHFGWIIFVKKQYNISNSIGRTQLSAINIVSNLDTLQYNVFFWKYFQKLRKEHQYCYIWGMSQ